jgi:hypothetical protein
MSKAMSGSRSKNSQADLATKLVEGIQKRLSAVAQVTFGGSTFTPAAVEAQLQALATLRSDVTAAKAAVETKLSAERTKGPALRVFLLAFVSFVRATFGDTPDVLADFGLKPKKVATPPTAEQLAAKALKAKATRKARGTVGKKKKLAIKGDVTGVVVTPVTTASPAKVASNVPNTSPNGGTQ